MVPHLALAAVEWEWGQNLVEQDTGKKVFMKAEAKKKIAKQINLDLSLIFSFLCVFLLTQFSSVQSLSRV